MQWRDKVALVTGASRGIGRAIAVRLAEAGIRVAVNYRGQAEAAQETAALIEAKGSESLLLPADVSRQDEAQQLIDSVVERWGRLDILVNNAGITRDTLLLRMRSEDWADVIQTDLSSVFYCTRAAAKPMVKQRYGRIVNISSIAGILGNAGQANYAAAKAGIIGFSRAVARELASRNITVNVVAPGIIDTDLTQGMSKPAYQALVEQVPLGRAGRPEDIADAVWYFIQADYVTGQTLVVDGGLVMD
ncbi:3-oxoacyl-(acyl-carrier-protein) reductase [Sulfobacillus acidophilus TPY]|uniref:3-oxoacyl-[acyl-carrier-protein] reductase n=1 Tax=Sulfobacillus acidophilus (strain ATCC 700253 / DSM 10332 / NAL) TaxID=679936 RepID=G8TVH9_SULAD|nr:3-oxoacyl-(acyl-carrier-protein) reductase [Sulfobacillus acidophilus TPY]AEW05898.1 3-oxoacyl-(acyl-carrier-protein) reductase [Sulfobacillus acidophilus DSM 10332]